MSTLFFLHIQLADSSTPTATVVQSPGYYSDCDDISSIPLPEGGAIEGKSDYTCDPDTDDCHLLIHDTSANVVYESYGTNVVSGEVHSACLIRWELDRVYPNNLRGEQCTSADAAGISKQCTVV